MFIQKKLIGRETLSHLEGRFIIVNNINDVNMCSSRKIINFCSSFFQDPSFFFCLNVTISS